MNKQTANNIGQTIISSNRKKVKAILSEFDLAIEQKASIIFEISGNFPSEATNILERVKANSFNVLTRTSKVLENTILNTDKKIDIAIEDTEKIINNVVTVAEKDMRTATSNPNNITYTEIDITELNPTLEHIADEADFIADKIVNDIQKDIDKTLADASNVVQATAKRSKDAAMQILNEIGTTLEEKLSNTETKINTVRDRAIEDVNTALIPLKEDFNNQLETKYIENKNKVDDIISNVKRQAGEMVADARKTIETAMGEAKKEVDALSDVGKENLEVILKESWDNINKTLLEDGFQKEDIKKAINIVIEEAKKKIPDLKDAATESLGNVTEKGLEAFEKLKSQAIEKAKEIGKEILNEAYDIGKEKVKDWAKTAVQKVLDKITNSNKSKFVIIEKCKKQIKNALEKVIGKIDNREQNIDNKIEENIENKTEDQVEDNIESKQEHSSSNYNNSYEESTTSHPQTNSENQNFKGELEVGGKRYAVVECDYEFFQSTDETGKPTSRTKGGKITFVTPTLSDEDLFFYHWMVSKTETKSGYFRFSVYSFKNINSYKTIIFKNAYCISLKDYFNDKDSRLMYSTITIFAEIIIIGANQGVLFSNEWS